MKVAIGLVITSFICLILFLGLSGPFGQIIDMIDEESESYFDDNPEYHEDVSDNLSLYQWAFGFAFILFMISGVVAAILESHRKEHEEYSYYDKYY